MDCKTKWVLETIVRANKEYYKELALETQARELRDIEKEYILADLICIDTNVYVEAHNLPYVEDADFNLLADMLLMEVYDESQDQKEYERRFPRYEEEPESYDYGQFHTPKNQSGTFEAYAC